MGLPGRAVNLTLKQLETFLWVADLGSFRKAAERLHTTQPNVSVRIAALERELGVTLMERDAGSVRLTSQGQALLEHARRAVRSVESMIDAAAGADLFEGVLRLGVTEMIVHTWLRDFIKAFKQRFPNMQIELTVDLSANLDLELNDKAIDLAFQSGPFVSPTTGNQPLGNFPIVWVASPELDLPVSRPVSAEELAHHAVLTHARNTLPYKELVNHFAQQPELNVRLVPSTSLAACLQMTLDGYGTAALLAPIVEEALASGDLHTLDYAWRPSRLAFSARYDAVIASSVVGQAAELASAVALEFAQQAATND